MSLFVPLSLAFNSFPFNAYGNPSIMKIRKQDVMLGKIRIDLYEREIKCVKDRT